MLVFIHQRQTMWQTLIIIYKKQFEEMEMLTHTIDHTEKGTVAVNSWQIALKHYNKQQLIIYYAYHIFITVVYYRRFGNIIDT